MTKKEFDIEEHIFHFGLDHLELYGTFKDELFIDGHKGPQDVKIINGFYFDRKRVDKYTYKLIFYGSEDDKKENNCPLFAYYKGLALQSIPTKDYIVVFSTGFRLLSEDRILYFLSYFHITKTKRLDIALDLNLDIDFVLDNFKKLSQRGATFNGENGDVETRYIGEKQKTKNKRQLIRIYNKQLDIIAKKKHAIYSEYLLEEHITRIELEVRSELAKNSYYENLFNTHFLLGIFKNYISKQSDLFSSIPGENITLYKKKDAKIVPELYQSTYYRDNRRKIFLGHAKLVFNLGYCPIRVLIKEGYIKELTKKAIGIENCEELVEKERKVKELAKHDKYTRQNLEEILANYYKYGG